MWCHVFLQQALPKDMRNYMRKMVWSLQRCDTFFLHICIPIIKI
jgi:hypothetical protein